MRPPVTTVELRAHPAATAYLVERSGDTALVVVRGDDPGIPPGIVTDVSQAVADGRLAGIVDVPDLPGRDRRGPGTRRQPAGGALSRRTPLISSRRPPSSDAHRRTTCMHDGQRSTSAGASA